LGVSRFVLKLYLHNVCSMAPKAASAKEKLGEQEEILQAVILADSFNSRFKPLTIAKPRVGRSSPSSPLSRLSTSAIALALVRARSVPPADMQRTAA
jgi:hypothetical protein